MKIEASFTGKVAGKVVDKTKKGLYDIVNPSNISTGALQENCVNPEIVAKIKN